jgi:NAD(P)-dependent dehydrogenase (short-subunit alcohol dehydrogenase family)
MVRLKPVGEQVVVVMGASSGIGGRLTALRFAERGARVVASARGREGLGSLVEEIRETGGEATAIPAEVADFEQVKAVADRAVITSQQISPHLLDALLERFGFEVHYTDEPKSEDDPDNLFGPVRGLDAVEGSFGDRAHPRSLYNWLELRPALKRAAAFGAALGTLAVLRGRS